MTRSTSSVQLSRSDGVTFAVYLAKSSRVPALREGALQARTRQQRELFLVIPVVNN